MHLKHDMLFHQNDLGDPEVALLGFPENRNKFWQKVFAFIWGEWNPSYLNQNMLD